MEDINVTGAGHQIIHSEYVSLMSKRAKGELPEMSCAQELIAIIRDKTAGFGKDKTIKKLLDIKS
mgnify:CR=1 FL=1